MSIAFRPPREPPDPPLDAIMWRVFRKDGREARAVVRSVGHGKELRIYVGDDMRWSRLYRQHDGTEALLEMSHTTLAAYEARGWRREMTV
jgi:hypothetical protein